MNANDPSWQLRWYWAKEGILEADLYYNVSFGHATFAVKYDPYFNDDIPF
jgi:hypothetical protein